MKQINSIAISLFGGLLLAAGCVKEADMNEMYRPEGTPIVFSAATGYENGNGTRTEYSGALYGESHNLLTDVSTTENTYERIDWVVNDQIKLVYTHPGSGSPATANYQITGKTNENELSHGAISVMSDSQQLVWAGGAGNHVFTGVYPAPGFQNNNSITFNGTQLGGLIPSSQTLRSNVSGRPGVYLPEMKYAYMAAYKKIDGSSTESEVHLPFVPAMTAFEIRLRKPATPATGESGASYKVKGFKMKTSATNDYLAGNFTIDITGANSNGRPTLGNAAVTNNGNRSTEVSVSFTTPVELSSSADLNFTLLTLPIDHTKITLTVIYDDGTSAGKTKSVNLKTSGGQALTFDACKKYIITNYLAGTDDWEYFVDASNDVVTYGHDAASGSLNIYSYKQSKADPTIKAIVPWKIQYTTVANPSESDWNDLTSSGVNNSTLNANFKVGTLTGQGAYPANPTANTASVTGQTPGDSSGEEGGTDPGTAARAKLASASPRGSSSAPFDLSRHPFYGNNIDGTPGNINSANCYVVSAPGYYMFPCVYGNSIKNSADNPSSYHPSVATDACTGDGNVTQLKQVNSYYNTTGYAAHAYLPTFYNAWNNPISSPFIWTDCRTNIAAASAIVVWQDTAEHDEIIPYKTGQITNPEALGVTTKTVTIDGASTTCWYIWFKIEPENIKPGNIMIALRDGDYIVWSWHIWVTEKDLEPKAADSYQLTLRNEQTSTDYTETFTVMPFNLGWLDSASGSVTKYKDREMRYRVVQNDGISTLNDEFLFTQIGDAKTITPTVGGNPYYQWGRKDPLIPSTEGGGNRPFSQNPSLGTNITPTTGQNVVHSANLDYGSGIKYPYIYYSNDQTLGWMGGEAYPFFKTTYMMKRVNSRMTEPYTHSQAMKFFDYGLLPSLTGNFWVDYPSFFDTRQDNFLKLKADAPLHLGPFTSTQKANILSIDDVDPTGDHFQDGDFYNSYAPADKKAWAYNLWNNYIYTDQPAEDGYVADPNDRHTTPTKAAVFHANKFKTIYDPCPAGFTVPSKASYIGNSPVEYANVPHPGAPTERWKGAAPFPGLTIAPSTGDVAGVGVTINGILFPYTGARVCYNSGGAVVLTPEHQSDQGYYWTDNPLRMEPQASNLYDINSYFFYQHAYLLLLSDSSWGAQYFTRGSAASIRPMVDPKY